MYESTVILVVNVATLEIEECFGVELIGLVLYESHIGAFGVELCHIALAL